MVANIAPEPKCEFTAAKARRLADHNNSMSSEHVITQIKLCATEGYYEVALYLTDNIAIWLGNQGYMVTYSGQNSGRKLYKINWS